MSALLRPSLSTVQDSQNVYFVVYLVDRDKGKRHEHELARAFDPAGSSAIGKGMQRGDAFNDLLRHAAGSFGAGLGDMIADAFEVVRRVRSPTDAHQPR